MAKTPNRTQQISPDLQQKDLDFWQKSIDNCEEFMKQKHQLWRRLLNAYKLEMEINVDEPRKISRFYPLARQIIASISFNYPRVFLRVEDNAKQYQAEILERVANAGLEIINAKRHIQQASFDALFCCLGWLKFGVNPPGDEDLAPPYTANDSMQNGLFYIQRVNPFNLYVDPLCPPHDLSQARFIIEKMLVPLELLKKDKRFVHTGDIKATAPEETVDDVLRDIEESAYEEGDEKGAFDDAKNLGKMVLLYQVHDRIHKRQLTFAKGVKQPIQNIPHPFLAGEAGTTPDPVDPSKQLWNGEFTPTGGFLVEGGFPYYAIKYDLTTDSLYGLPMMAYAEDTQKGINESVGRRNSWLKRLSLIILANKAEQQDNPDVANKVQNGKDAEVLWVNDVNNSFRGMPVDNIPPDQLGIESDFRAYEDQILQTGQLVNSGQRTLTATQSALSASFGQLNREWLQQGPSEAYRVTVHNFLRISSDLRYTPRNFIINVAESDAEPVYEAVTSDLLKARFKVEIEPTSMRPLFEAIEKEDALALFNYMIQIPEIPRMEAIKHLLRTFRVPNMEKLVGESSKAAEQRSAQLENQWIAMRQEDPGVLPEQDHQAHMEIHSQIMQDPMIQQMIQANPMTMQALQQVMMQHGQAHAQALQAKGAGAPAPTNGKANINRVGPDGSPMGKVAGMVQGVESQVRSNAQEVSQPGAVMDRGQN